MHLREEVLSQPIANRNQPNGTFQYSWRRSISITYVSYIVTKLSEPDRFSINRVRPLTEAPLQAPSYASILYNL